MESCETPTDDLCTEIIMETDSTASPARIDVADAVTSVIREENGDLSEAIKHEVFHETPYIFNRPTDLDDSVMIIEPVDTKPTLGTTTTTNQTAAGRDEDEDDDGHETIIVLDSPEKDEEPPRKKLALSPSEEEVVASLADGETAEKTLRETPRPYNIFSSLLNVSAAASKAAASSSSSNSATPSPTPTVSNAFSLPSSRSTSPRASTPKGDAGASSTCCWLPFCGSKCDVKTHHPLLRALSTCLRDSSASNDDAVKAYEAFESVVRQYEDDAENGWKRTSTINEASMKEYYYPLLHTASVSGNVSLVRWMLSKGFGDFSQPICSPLMQCLLNIDCSVRKTNERVKIFKEMMELMPSEVMSPTLDNADRPTSLLNAVCGRASIDFDRPYYAASLRNMIAFLTDNFDVETQKRVFQIRNSDGNTCIHELSKLDECLPALKKLFEVCQRLDIVGDVFKTTNLRGKTPLDVAADAGAIRLVMFLSPIVPAASTKKPPPVRTPGEAATASKAADLSEVTIKLAEDTGMRKSERGTSTEKEKVQDFCDGEPSSIKDENSVKEDSVAPEKNEDERSELNQISLPVPVEKDLNAEKEDIPECEPETRRKDLFRPLFRDEMKAEVKFKIVEKHLTEKRKLVSDIKSRMEKYVKNLDDVKFKIEETEEDTKKKVENMKVLFEVLLRTQQSIGVNDAKLKELNTQLVGERKTIAMHEKVSQELTDVISLMEQLYSTLNHQVTLNSRK